MYKSLALGSNYYSCSQDLSKEVNIKVLFLNLSFSTNITQYGQFEGRAPLKSVKNIISFLFPCEVIVSVVSHSLISLMGYITFLVVPPPPPTLLLRNEK